MFIESYKHLRSGINANEIVEMLAILAMLPPLSHILILDVGCGYGEHCVKYVEMGADEALGIDISEKMLDIANKENQSPRITYKKFAMEELAEFDQSFDLVVSSLALHYVKIIRRL